MTSSNYIYIKFNSFQIQHCLTEIQEYHYSCLFVRRIVFEVGFKTWLVLNYSIIRNMSLLRKSTKTSLKTTVEDFTAAIEQKNSIIHSLQNELQTLRPNQQKFMRNKQEITKAKSKYQCLIKDYETTVSNNAERLELTAKNVQQLRIQAQHYNQDLKLKAQTLREAKFITQQLVDLQNKRQDESAECKIKFQEYRNTAEVFKLEYERTRIQICQLGEEMQKAKKENYLLRNQNQDVNQKQFETQSYIRGLAREQANLNENLSKIEDENQKLNSAISQLSTLIAVNQSTIYDKEKDIQQINFNIANKQLQKKKVENEIKERIKLLSAEKQKSRLLTEQLEQKKNESKKIDSYLEEVCSDITLIFAKNNQIQEVNSQLRQDLKVSEKHRENVLRNNKLLNCEIEALKEQNLQTVSKLQQPFKNRSNFAETATSQFKQFKLKWDSSVKSSRVTHFETLDFEKRTQRI